MNTPLPVSGDFSRGLRLPFWIAKILHHKWRFYMLAGAIAGAGVLLILGIKMPWKTNKVSIDDKDTSSGIVSLNLFDPLSGQESSNHDKDQGAEGQADNSAGSDSATDSTGGSGSGHNGGSGSGNGSGSGSSGGSRGTNAPSNTGGFPTPQSTGPRYASQSTHNGDFTTTSNGQIIENMTINGRLRIRHSNVVVRDVTVNATGRYMIHVERINGVCTSGVRIEYTELNGANHTEDIASQMYAQCPTIIDHMYIHDVGIGIRLGSGSSVTNSYILANRTWSGAHKEAILNGGPGQSVVVDHNTLICTGAGCSSAMSIYGDFGQQDDWLITNNLFATTGGFCLYAGSEDHEAYPDATNIRITNNRFSTQFHPLCGRYGAITAYESGRGNVRSGNVWHESGIAID